MFDGNMFALFYSSYAHFLKYLLTCLTRDNNNGDDDLMFHHHSFVMGSVGEAVLKA